MKIDDKWNKLNYKEKLFVVACVMSKSYLEIIEENIDILKSVKEKLRR